MSLEYHGVKQLKGLSVSALVLKTKTVSRREDQELFFLSIPINTLIGIPKGNA